MVRADLMISFGALLFSLGQAVIIRDYNRVDFHEFSSIEELHAVFFSNVDDEGNRRAVGNLVLGTATEACWNLLESPAFRGVQRHAGGIMSSATIPASKSPVSLEGDSCAELLFFRKGWLISEPSYRLRDEVEMREGGSAVPALSHMRVNEWLRSFNSISVHITNSFDFNVDIWWVEESVVPRVDVQDIPSSGAVDMQTFLGHTFAVKKAGTNEVVDYFAVDGGPYEMGPWNRIETCEFEPDSLFFTPLPEGGFDCTDMNWRLDEWVNTEWYQKRLGLNYVQPQLVEPVTEAGFDLRRLPTHTFEWLRDWYYAEMARSGQSEEGLAGPCMNQHAAPTLMVHLPQTGEFSKDRLSRELQEELEGWYGKGPLRLTSIYGIRRYVNGSVLRMHVDTANTHVVSGIINVDQQVEEPWLLKILDHDDQEHDLPMRPGDLLLYESAKLLHGRPEPFKGDFYDNIFIHYMPVSGWDYNWI